MASDTYISLKAIYRKYFSYKNLNYILKSMKLLIWLSIKGENPLFSCVSIIESILDMVLLLGKGLNIRSVNQA